MNSSKRAALDALHAVTASTAVIVRGEITQAKAIVALAQSYTVDCDEMSLVEEVQEGWVEYGDDGTPLVSEYLILELGAALGITPKSAAHMLVQVLNLYYRHPRLWAAFVQGKIRRWQADQLTDITSELSAEAADWVDKQIGLTVGRMAFTRLRPLVKGWVVKADPALPCTSQRRRRLLFPLCGSACFSALGQSGWSNIRI